MMQNCNTFPDSEGIGDIQAILGVSELSRSVNKRLSGGSVAKSYFDRFYGCGEVVMRHSKSIAAVVAVAGAVFGIGSASAADLAARPYTKAPPMVAAAVYDWSGFYIGANGGWGEANRNPHITVGGLDIDLGRDSARGGGTFGGQVGYRWQSSSWVFGVEAQGNWADINGSHNLTLFGVPIPGTVGRSRLDAFGLFTGQVGYAWNNWLLYVKGGGAITNNTYNVDFFGLNVLTSRDQTRSSGVVGVGFEYGFSRNWSVALEYDHLFEGNRNSNFVSVPGGVFVGTANIRGDVDLVTARVNYHFNGPVVAKY